MAPTGSYLGTWTNTANKSSYTYTQATHGLSPAAGIIILATSGQHSVSVTGVTMNSVSMTQQPGAITSGSRTLYFFAIQHSGGDLGDIVVTLSGGGSRNAIAVYGITERTNITADDFDSGDTTDPLSGTVDTTANCYVMAAVACSDGGTFTWTNLTERYDTTIEGTNQWTGASDTITSAGTVTPSADASMSLFDGVIIVLSYFLSNSVTMTASPGSYAYTGVAAGLLQARKLIADVGTFVYSGVTAGTLAALKMAADAGSYALTGIDVIFRFGKVLTAEAGAYTYTGVAATLQAIVSMPAAAGTYAYTGVDASLKAAKILTAEVGAYIYSGIDVIFLKGQLLIAEAGAYVLTGVATLKHIVMRNLTGSYAYTGVAASLTFGKKLIAEAGAYVLTGFTLQAIVSMPAAAGAYVYTGFDAGLKAAKILTAEVGAYIYSGIDVIFLKGQLLIAEAGAYVLTGVATLKHIVLQHLAGAYTYTGISATLKHIVLQQKLLIAEAGSYVMTGFNAVLVYRLPLAAPAAWVKRKVQATLASTRAAAASLFKRRQVQSKLSRRRQSDPELGD